jgi:hypothetical protein
MSERTISIGFTDEEYTKILKSAQSERISISQYIKAKVILNEFSEKYKDLIKKALKIEPGLEFSVKDIFGYDEWGKISRGVKLSLGKHFYKNVKNGNINNVSIKGFGIAGIMLYTKK